VLVAQGRSYTSVVFTTVASVKTSAQQQLRWETVPEQSGPKSWGCCAPFRGGAGSPSKAVVPC